MTSAATDTSREQSLDLLNEMILHASQLKISLQDENRALEAQDLIGIDAAVQAKAVCNERLQGLDNKRLELCRAGGFDAGPEQMEQLIGWCDDDGRIRNRWDRLMSIATESNALNMTNGAIIRVRQQQFESSLSVLRGVTPGSDIYGPSGGDKHGYGHRSLAQA